MQKMQSNNIYEELYIVTEALGERKLGHDILFQRAFEGSKGSRLSNISWKSVPKKGTRILKAVFHNR